MGREREVLLLLPEEGAVDGEFGVQIEEEFIGQSEHTRCKITRPRTKSSWNGNEKVIIRVYNRMSRSSRPGHRQYLREMNTD